MHVLIIETNTEVNSSSITVTMCLINKLTHSNPQVTFLSTLLNYKCFRNTTGLNRKISNNSFSDKISLRLAIFRAIILFLHPKMLLYDKPQKGHCPTPHVPTELNRKCRKTYKGICTKSLGTHIVLFPLAFSILMAKWWASPTCHLLRAYCLLKFSMFTTDSRRTRACLGFTG